MTIPNGDINITKYYRKAILYHKKYGQKRAEIIAMIIFDVTIAIFDGAFNKY